MASTSAVEETSSTEEHVFEEEIEEETVDDGFMDEAHQFFESEKKMRMAYGGHGMPAQETVSAEEYQEVDVEEYAEASHIQPLNLPDLISRRINVGNDFVTFCFSKQGIHQLASNGFLYNLDQQDRVHNTYTCINYPDCTAQILTAHESDAFERSGDVHAAICEPDEVQLALRIGIYDLRLLAEFTDTSLELLYHGYVEAFANGEPQLAELFPPFHALHRSLKEHRRYRYYKRAFDANNGIDTAEKRMEEEIDLNEHNMLLSLGEEEVVEESYAERVPREAELAIRTGQQLHMHPYGRTRGWPPTFCAECGVDMPTPINVNPVHGRSNNSFTPQHALIQHVSRLHLPIKINACVFEPSSFEMWLREVQRCPALRFRRFSLIGEDFFYLCSCDQRLPRSKYTKDACCTAYIKIQDYREVSARRARLVSIEYSFEHFFHEIDGLPSENEKQVAELRPDEFLLQLERRKEATAQLVRSRQELNTRRNTIASSIALRTTIPTRVPENVFSAARSDSRTTATRSVATANKPVRQPATPATALKPEQQPAGGVITRRANFKDQATYDAVRQFEQLAHIAIRRLQHAKSARVADQYSELMRKQVVNRIVADRECAPETSAKAIWKLGTGVPEVAASGKNEKKRVKEEEVEDIEEEEGERKKARKEEGAEKGKEGGVEKEGETVKEGQSGETGKEDSADDNEQERVKKRGGRSQLPVRSTLVATGRVVEKDKEKEKEKEKEEGKEKEKEKEKGKEADQSEAATAPSLAQAVRRKMVEGKKEEEGKSLPPILARSKSSRIQARKEKEGEAEPKKD